jgi:hypothetical protein
LDGKPSSGQEAQNDVPDPKRHFAIANYCSAKGFFDHLVGGGEQQLPNCELFKLWRRLYRQIGQLFALEEVVNVGHCAQVKVVIVDAVKREAAKQNDYHL